LNEEEIFWVRREREVQRRYISGVEDSGRTLGEREILMGAGVEVDLEESK
jgi:hypothetical protein